MDETSLAPAPMNIGVETLLYALFNIEQEVQVSDLPTGQAGTTKMLKELKSAQ